MGTEFQFYKVKKNEVGGEEKYRQLCIRQKVPKELSDSIWYHRIKKWSNMINYEIQVSYFSVLEV